eukprot:TRINITY_DN15993_c0_g1_i1.p1 TRINITY_DN15993_c0_g1~~TRINITY_DN15993_c0_g1_i1.p1  ORF type:complete len:135 (+),score=26.42 TRINITY_DN15993_c0_g1_i1:109-513(+)
MSPPFMRQRLIEDVPIFTKSKVSYSPNHPILFFRTRNHVIVLLQADKNLEIIHQNSGHMDRIHLADMLGSFKVHDLFLDPTGTNILLSLKPDKTSETPCVLYIPRESKQPKILNKAKGELITAVGWSGKESGLF